MLKMKIGTWKAAALAGGMVLALAAAQPALAAWTVTAFDRAGASDSQLWGINDAGQFVGSDSLGGYLVSGGLTTPLSGPDGALRATPFAISNGGLVVGAWYGADDSEHGFLLQDGQYTNFDIGLPGVVRTEIRHVSLDGRWLTGIYVDASGQQNGFVFDRSGAALQTVGTEGVITFMQGANSDGLAVGSQSPGGGLVFDAGSGSLQAITRLAGVAGAPRFRDINDAGLITGFAGGQAIVGTLADGFTVLSLGAGSTSFGEGLNNVGQLVGTFTDLNGVTHGFIASSVPEPSSLMAMATGLAALGGFLRRRARRAEPLLQPAAGSLV